jgi:hypothetical protein
VEVTSLEVPSAEVRSIEDLPTPGTSATRAPDATTHASDASPAGESGAAITSTRSPGRSSRTVAASVIRTGADTISAAGARRSRSGAAANASAPGPSAPRAPEAASAAAVSARPAASARRRRRIARRSRCAPPRTRSGANDGTPSGSGAGEAGRDGGGGGGGRNDMTRTTCREEWTWSDHASRSTPRTHRAEACGRPPPCGQLPHPPGATEGSSESRPRKLATEPARRIRPQKPTEAGLRSRPRKPIAESRHRRGYGS